jgi:hypothetical protein
MDGRRLSAYSCGGSAGFPFKGTGFPLSFGARNTPKNHDEAQCRGFSHRCQYHIKKCLYRDLIFSDFSYQDRNACAGVWR